MDRIQDNMDEQQAQNQKGMRFNINDSVWIAAAAMTYEIYYRKQNAGQSIYVPDFALVQSDICNRTEVINGHRAEVARTSQWCCGDHDNHTYCFLRAIVDKRRLSFPGEFGGKEEPESLKMDETISTDVGSITIRQLHDFVHKEYAALEEQIIRKTDIDYKAPLEYIDKHSKEEYAGPDKPVLPEKRAKMDKLKESAQNAVKQIQRMMVLCEKTFTLMKSNKKGVQWLDGTRQNTKDYLWGELKNPDHMDSPISISIFADKNFETLQPRYRISLEIMNKNADKALMQQYHSYLDMEPDARHGLAYGGGNNVEILKGSHDTIKAQIEAGVYEKVQYCKLIDRNEAYSNEDYEHQILEGVAALMPFYEHVVGISKPEYWPIKDKYDPGISVDMWKELLTDPEVTLVENLQMFKMMLELGGEATCAKLAKVYGGSYASYNGLGRAFGERVYQKTNCPLCTDGDRERRYTIPFVGRKVVEDGKNRYSWKIREELQEALESMDLSEIDIEKKQNFNKDFSKNMILYGPPGTGKTYNTVKYAVAICEGKSLSEYDQMDYVDILRKYEKFKAEGRIAFTTFHQSYGYEEFIEGIKPIVDQTKKEVGYMIEPGVFKKFCDNARTIESNETGTSVNAQAQIWKLTIKGGDMNPIKQECFNEGNARMGFDYDTPDARAFVEDVALGDIILSFKTRRTIDGIAVVTGDIEELPLKDTYQLSRKVTWIAKDIDEDITGINAGKLLHRMTFAKVPNMQLNDILEIAEKYPINGNATEVVENVEPYVFIIDEINRGNISKIFGELITLIENTKRAGMPEATSAILPYSGEPFSVPSNVYILGTMNTADRSIALMDTALRRRFQFEEMMPDTKVLIKIGADKISKEGIELNVVTMLETINERIEYLFDREHTIGHAFFTELKDEPTVEKLASIFKKSVIPLLQEYFYEDYGKIMLVLGDNGKTNDSQKFIIAKEIKPNLIFRGDTSDIDVPDYVYEIQDKAFYDIMSYIEIIG